MNTIRLFGTAMCAPCQMMKKTLDTMHIDYEFVNCSENPSIAIKNNITTVPVLVVYNEKGEELTRRNGLLTVSTIDEMVGV